MSKRSREETNGVGIDAARKEKKDKVKRRRISEDAAESAPTGPNNGLEESFVEDTARADKAARKAAKKAKKEAKEAAKKTALVTQRAAKKQYDALSEPEDDCDEPEANGNNAAGHLQSENTAQPSEQEVKEFLEASQITIIEEKDQAQSTKPIMTFDQLPLQNAKLKEVFASYKKPTPIQSAAWPYLLAGRDAIGVAETGSGKTMAFGLPCVQHVAEKSKGKSSLSIRACIVSPTRELAMQIHEQMVKLAGALGLKAACVYGGVNKDAQRETLRGVSIIVATPGRLNDFIEEGSIDLNRVSYLVLDEADRMLDKGFEPEVRKIVSATKSKGRQTLMFTATWPPAVRELAATFMDNPVRIMIGDNATGELRANTRIEQKVEVIDPQGKNARLIEVLRQYGSSKAQADRILIFCLYKKEAVRVEDFVRSRGFKVAGIHGDLNQTKRTESLEAFKQGNVRLLIATDVAARGLDIPAVKLVVNYTFPLSADDYVHRIGRTGRAGQTGESITFFTEHDKPLAGALVNVLKAANQEVPESLLKFGTTVKKKEHGAYGPFYREPGEMKKATKITFD